MAGLSKSATKRAGDIIVPQEKPSARRKASRSDLAMRRPSYVVVDLAVSSAFMVKAQVCCLKLLGMFQ